MSCRRLVPVLVFLCVLLILHVDGKKHRLVLKEDDRQQITLSTFGFVKGGVLAVSICDFSYETNREVDNLTLFGFTLDKSGSRGLSSVMENDRTKCILQDDLEQKKDSISVVSFKMDLKNNKILIEKKGNDVTNLTISDMDYEAYLNRSREHKNRRSTLNKNNNFLLHRQTRDTKSKIVAVKTDSITITTVQPNNSVTSSPILDHTDVKTKIGTEDGIATSAGSKNIKEDKSAKVQTLNMDKKDGKWNAHFVVEMKNEAEEGLYNLFFHNCLTYIPSVTSVSMTLNIVEVNNGNFLSAGSQPEPTLFFAFFILYFMAGVVWLLVLRRAEKQDVFKIHYLMLSVVWVKSLTCLFHGINSHFIEKSGIPEEAWAILWYIVYLTKGALMFGTILLIGAGWAFIKHVFSKKEKKLFAIFLPLQILNNVAWVIVEESDEGTSRYTTWRNMLFAVDLLCCGAILFPVVWSIRHLQEASAVDGKAAMNLNKLKLFRHFYIMVVCYIYFTRMIVYLLEITLPFRHQWLKDLSCEIAVFSFFCITGYKFQPATDNPYLQVPQDSDDEIEMEEVLTKTGATDNLTKVNQHLTDKKPDEENNLGIKQRESSLEYD